MSQNVPCLNSGLAAITRKVSLRPYELRGAGYSNVGKKGNNIDAQLDSANGLREVRTTAGRDEILRQQTECDEIKLESGKRRCGRRIAHHGCGGVKFKRNALTN